MLLEIQQTEQESRRLGRVAWLILGLGLAASVGMWRQAASSLQAEADVTFEHRVTDITLELNRLVDHHIDLMATVQALFKVSHEVDRRTFHRQVQSLEARRGYPGLLAVQYSPLIHHSQRQDLEARVRADTSLQPDGYPDFVIQTEGQPDELMPIVYNEPLEPNQRAFGLDVLSRPLLREVVLRARDRGVPQLSAPVQLAQGGLGLILRLPLYLPEASISTQTERRAAFLGTVSGVFRSHGMLSEIVQHKRWDQLQWRVSDLGPSEPSGLPSPRTLIFDTGEQIAGGLNAHASADSVDMRRTFLDVAGRRWALEFTRAPVYPHLQPYPLALLIGGCLSTLALAWAMRSAASRNRKAARMADKLSQQARDSEERLRSVMDHTVDGILTISTTGEILSANRAVRRIFGYPEDALIGAHLSALLPAAAGHTSVTSIDDFLKLLPLGIDGVGRRTEGRRASGQTFPLDLALSTMELDGVTQHIGVLRDLHAQENAERAILEAHRQLNEVDEMRRVIVHNAPYAIFVLNPQGVIQTVNPAGERLVGYSSQELVGRQTTRHFFDPEQVAERARMLSIRLNQQVVELDVLRHLAIESPGLPSEWTVVRSDGEHLTVEILVTELRTELGELSGYLAMAHDVTARRDAEHQLQHMALHDALTALPNRNMLQDQLKASVSRAEREQGRMAMMFLDLDRFKKINDTLGHHVGDAVITEVARRLRMAMRTSDIVARLGGDEFVVLLPSITEREDGELVARKVMELFREPLHIEGQELRVTPSIGLVLYPDHGTDAVTLMRHADLAMYQAKNNGRNRIQVYSEQTQSLSAESLMLENELYKALERDELRLHYQPQFDCQSGLITGAEALLRWEHDGRLVSPADFIPLAEESGLIVPMGEWVLQRACHMAQQWRASTGWPLRISVNLSAVQLDQPDIADTVARALTESGLPPTALELEITESVVVRESLRVADVLTHLRALGVSIAIDDFGVGYSSFAYLRELPVDRFKLDRSFLTAVPQSSGDSRLVAALIAMGHRLEVGIVAEGVETEAQAMFLRAHGCDEAQGFHLAKPLKEDAFEALLREHSSQHVKPLAEQASLLS